jgi:hypothetical protein
MALTRKTHLLALCIVLEVFVLYYFSNPKPSSYYDYTFRIAGTLLHGRLGLEEPPPSWLNEMVPLNGRYYSAFPLGSVLTMLPLALAQQLGLIRSFPGAAVAAFIAGAVALFFYLLSTKYDTTLPKRAILALFPVFGTWMWCNLAFAGAWQIALGFGVLGQLGALYFLLINPKPFLAGLFFALAYGNRTEIILLAPIFVYLICRPAATTPGKLPKRWEAVSAFLVAPFVLGVWTLAYNYARFSSIFDFGYARIPGVLEEPWFRHGIWSIYAIPLNARQMLIEPWIIRDHYPYLVPTGFGGSIFLSSPFLFLLFRKGARDPKLKLVCWGAIIAMTLVLWCHGNPGGWQFSYRYAMVLLPWMFFVLLENSPREVTSLEAVLFGLSVTINAYATYLFFRTDYVRP